MAAPPANDPRGVADRGTDDAGVIGAGRMIGAPDRIAGARQVARLDSRNSAIVDEALLRGASIDEVMQVLFARALARLETDAPVARYGSAERASARERPRAGGRRRSRRFTLEDLYYLEERDLTDRQQRRLDDVEDLRPLVAERFDAYVTLAKEEFDKLPAFVKASFTPMRGGRYGDAYANAADKYRGMRGAYYRAGWIAISRDILQLIRPADFFGVSITGGVHREMAALLKLVEAQVRKGAPAVGNQLASAGFVIGGFVPRFQGESDQLSSHAYGLAIDVDATWNPQVKTKAAVAAFQRATGERLDVLLWAVSSLDAIRQTHRRVAKVSVTLKEWLNKWLPKYDHLQSDRALYKKDPKAKEKVAAIDKELKTDLDLAALNTLIVEYTRRTVDAWRAYGIVSIPAEIVEAFVALGKGSAARWGGEYEHSKDVMHLELLKLDAKDSLGRPGAAGRRAPVSGLDDLVRGEVRPAQRLGEGRRKPPPSRRPVRPPARARAWNTETGSAAAKDDNTTAKKKSTKPVLRMDPIEIRGVMRMDPIEITPTPQPPPELDRILDFLTGRGQKTPHPTDPPPDVPPNVTCGTRYHSPGFPSREVPGNQETSIKRWMYEAARYNSVPVVLMAVILQQENAPTVSETVKQLQSGERRLQTLAGEKDEQYWGIMPDKFAGGSTGIANLSRQTLRDAAAYLETRYRKPVIPDAIRNEKGDPRLAGIDEQLDLYYMSAVLRQLIDRHVSPTSVGNLSDDAFARVAQAYNGSGPKAIKYRKDAVARLNAARQGTVPLLFLGPPPDNPSLPMQLSIARGLGF